jgi:hypothetical protein
VDLHPHLGHVYAIAADTTAADVEMLLSLRLDQLAAMLQLVCGNGAENFSGYSDDIQSSYLYGCAMLAEECKALHQVEYRLAREKRTPKGGAQ